MKSETASKRIDLGKRKGRAHTVLVRLATRNASRLSILIIVAAVLCASFAESIAPKDPYAQDLTRRLRAPVGFPGNIPGYYLGTDQLGRDILSRIILGARISLLICLLAVIVSGVLGIAAGLVSGYYGGKIDLVMMRLIDMQLAFPVVLLVIAVVAVVGPSLSHLIVIMGFSGWPRFARIARGSVLAVKAEQFVDAARSVGASHLRVMVQHILPNILSAVIVYATFDLARMILLEATLGFLGLGVQPPTPTWGAMINDGRQYIYLSWAASLMPGLAIVLIILAFNMLGDELRDALDPQLTESR